MTSKVYQYCALLFVRFHKLEKTGVVSVAYGETKQWQRSEYVNKHLTDNCVSGIKKGAV